MKCYSFVCAFLVAAVLAEEKQKRSREEILAELEVKLENIDKMVDTGYLGVAVSESRVEGICPVDNAESCEITLSSSEDTHVAVDEDSVEEAVRDAVEEPVVAEKLATGMFSRLVNWFW